MAIQSMSPTFEQLQCVFHYKRNASITVMTGNPDDLFNHFFFNFLKFLSFQDPEQPPRHTLSYPNPKLQELPSAARGCQQLSRSRQERAAEARSWQGLSAAARNCQNVPDFTILVEPLGKEPSRYGQSQPKARARVWSARS